MCVFVCRDSVCLSIGTRDSVRSVCKEGVCLSVGTVCVCRDSQCVPVCQDSVSLSVDGTGYRIRSKVRETGRVTGDGTGHGRRGGADTKAGPPCPEQAGPVFRPETGQDTGDSTWETVDWRMVGYGDGRRDELRETGRGTGDGTRYGRRDRARGMGWVRETVNGTGDWTRMEWRLG